MEKKMDGVKKSADNTNHATVHILNTGNFTYYVDQWRPCAQVTHVSV